MWKRTDESGAAIRKKKERPKEDVDLALSMAHFFFIIKIRNEY